MLELIWHFPYLFVLLQSNYENNNNETNHHAIFLHVGAGCCASGIRTAAGREGYCGDS
jgi:hypothetical protein